MRALLAILVLLTTLPCDGQVRRRVLGPKPSSGSDPYHQGTNQLTYTNNLVFWVMGNAGVWTNKLGGSNAVNGDYVGRWLDLSTNKQDLMQGSSRMVYYTNGPGGFPQIYSPGDGAAMLTNDLGLSVPQPFTTFYVLNATNLGVSDYVVDETLNAPFLAWWFWNDTLQGKYALQAGAGAKLAGLYIQNVWHLVDICWNGATTYMRTNGLASANPSASPGTNEKRCVLLGRADPGALIAYYAEVLIYAEEMTTNNLQLVERYLAYKYKLWVP